MLLLSIGLNTTKRKMLVQGDPTYLADKERHFIDIAKVISKGSTHP